MARLTRRSARLQKQTPDAEPIGSFAQEAASSKPVQSSLDSVPEQAETPKATATRLTLPDVPKSPIANSKIRSFPSPESAHTPKNRTPLRPSGEAMHPEHHHQSTTTPFEEARWLGILARGAQTAPPKGTTSQLAIEQGTPTKAVSPSRNPFSSPNFKFHFKRTAELELTPSTKRMMEESREETTSVRASVISSPKSMLEKKVGTSEGDAAIAAIAAFSARKIKQPKSRFSDAHNKQFNLMNSIANQRSVTRPSSKMLKTGTKQVVTPSLAPVARSLKRTQSKAELDEDGECQSEMARPKFTVRRVPPSRHGESSKNSSFATTAAPAKRVKHHEGEDTSTRPSSRDETEQKMPASPTGHGIARFNMTSIPKPPAFMTPTKSSLVRSQSVKSSKSSLFPSLMRPPSVRDHSPTRNRIGSAFQAGVRKTSNGLNRMKSILRTPQRNFSDDPMKIAAGTHIPMLTPVRPNIHKALPAIPATAPVRKMKRVDFSASTVEREEAKIASPDTAGYPQLPSIDEPESPTRRITLGDLKIPGAFSFRSDRQATFSPAPESTIRAVRNSDASIIQGGTKRKHESSDESSGSDKENSIIRYTDLSKRVEEAVRGDEGRPVKKMRMADPPAARSPILNTPIKATKTASRLPRKTPTKHRSGLTPSRLNFLSLPKQRGN